MAPPPPTKNPPLRSSDHVHDGKHHLLIASSGSVATIKLPATLHVLSAHSSNLSIRVILTQSATEFLKGQSPENPRWTTLKTIPGVEAIYTDADEWAIPWTRGAPILHIELRRWADTFLIAPLSANTLAKMVGGFSDNLLLSVLRAWDTTGTIDPIRYGKQKLVYVAPAMNTAMWLHPVTGRQMKELEEEWGWVEVLKPQEKTLACGDNGSGAMMEWRSIVEVVEGRIKLPLNTDKTMESLSGVLNSSAREEVPPTYETAMAAPQSSSTSPGPGNGNMQRGPG